MTTDLELIEAHNALIAELEKELVYIQRKAAQQRWEERRAECYCGRVHVDVV